MVKIVSDEEAYGTAGRTAAPTLFAGIKVAIDYLRIVDENDLKLVVKIRGVSTVEVGVEDDGKVISVDVVDPESLGVLAQQFRSVCMSSEE